MYAMLTCELPFGYDVNEVQEQIENKVKPKRPSEINPEAKFLDGVMMKCLKFLKKERRGFKAWISLFNSLKEGP